MLEKLTNWLKQALEALWNAFTEFMSDLFWMWVKHMLSMWLWVFERIPVPDFLSGDSLGSILGNAGPTVAWFIEVFKVPQSMAVIGAAMVFYVIRRALTVGIW